MRRHIGEETIPSDGRGGRVIPSRFANFPSPLDEGGRKRRLYKQKRRRRQQAQHEISFVESKASEGQIPWQRRDTSETRNTSTIPLISVATVRHLVKRIEIFQEQIVSMCGRAEYGGGLGTAQSDAWNVIVGLTKNARTADKDVITVRSIPPSLSLSRSLYPSLSPIHDRFRSDVEETRTHSFDSQDVQLTPLPTARHKESCRRPVEIVNPSFAIKRSFVMIIISRVSRVMDFITNCF